MLSRKVGVLALSVLAGGLAIQPSVFAADKPAKDKSAAATQPALSARDSSRLAVFTLKHIESTPAEKIDGLTASVREKLARLQKQDNVKKSDASIKAEEKELADAGQHAGLNARDLATLGDFIQQQVAGDIKGADLADAVKKQTKELHDAHKKAAKTEDKAK